MKNGVECYKDFFPYFKALKTNCALVLTSIIVSMLCSSFEKIFNIIKAGMKKLMHTMGLKKHSYFHLASNYSLFMRFSWKIGKFSKRVFCIYPWHFKSNEGIISKFDIEFRSNGNDSFKFLVRMALLPTFQPSWKWHIEWFSRLTFFSVIPWHADYF